MTGSSSNDKNDKEPKSFERVGPFTIDYERCYAGFGTAVQYQGHEYIVVSPDYLRLAELVSGPLGARIENGFHRVVVAPEAKAKSIPSANGARTPECPQGQDALVAGPAANGASGFNPERCGTERTLAASKGATCQPIDESLTPDESNRHESALSSTAAMDALRELVELKDMADRNADWPNLQGNMDERDEYRRRKPLAWQRAREVIAGASAPSSTGDTANVLQRIAGTSHHAGVVKNDGSGECHQPDECPVCIARRALASSPSASGERKDG